MSNRDPSDDTPEGEPAPPPLIDEDAFQPAVDARSSTAAEVADDDTSEALNGDDDGDDDGDEAAEDATDPGRALPARSTSRSQTGIFLLGAAGALWAVFGVMRCQRDEVPAEPAAAINAEANAEANPQANVPEAADADRPVPAEAPIPDGPTPASETPDRPPADTAPDDADADDDVDAPEGELGPLKARPAAASWAKALTAPDVVKYVVRRGGSIKNVANLYKIFHHEISALNPGVTLEQELPPKSGVVVYRASESEGSASVGGPSSGSLKGGVPMVDGPGRVMKMIGWKSFATANTVAVLDAVLRRWAKTGHSQPVIVGNMSAREGGKLSPHSTHQSGRDVDLGYPQILPKGEELNWRVMDKRNLDAKETWALLAMLTETGQIEVIYVDREIQKLLYEYAVGHKLMSKQALRSWMEYPAATGSGSPVIQHVKGHADHLHARFKCQPHETQCRSRKR